MNQSAVADEQPWNLIIVGAGTSGMSAAAFGGGRGDSVLLLDAAPTIGGTLLVAFGQLSAAGTKLQAQKGIVDSPEKHFAEALRISRGTIDVDLARLAIFNAGSTFDWLMDNGFDVLPECPSIESAHEPYEVARYYWGKELGLSICKVLEKVVRENEAAGRLTLRTNTRVERLLQDADGRVTGVETVNSAGERRRCLARNVVLASGGYAANPEMFQRLSGHPLYVKSAYSYAQGSGLDLGVAAGGYLRGHDKYLSNFGWLLESDQFPSPVIGRANTSPNYRQPWEIYVNTEARRFIREDEPSVDVREHCLLTQPHLRYWIIFDQAMLDAAPPIVYGWTREQIAEACNVKFPFRRAATIEQLARDIGIDAATLVQTVERYNAGQRAQRDEFGRSHMPAPISQGPFYAIRQQGGSVTSTVGLAVNPELQVIRKDGTPVPGLYAAGEILGSGQLQGNAFVGGMMATPAMVFGRLLGERLATVS